MADQPYYRPYEPVESGIFEDGRSNRPLERGVVHRGQHLEVDPLVTGLTRAEWARAYSLAVTPKIDFGKELPKENREIAIGSPRYDQRDPAAPKVFVEQFPFPMTREDLKRGQERYTIYCAVCHGPLGNGQGKIWERGYLDPTSFHTEKVDPEELEPRTKSPGLGIARGYATIWGITLPLRDAPVGYYFEVITKGYAGMPSYSAQIPPADRWRIIAYIKVLQLSRFAPAADLPDALKQRFEAGGKP